LLQLVLRTGNR